MVSVGTIVWLSSELMFFAALFACLLHDPRRSAPSCGRRSTELLNVPFAAVNTTILVLSSVTCQLGVFAAERGQVGRTGSVLNVERLGPARVVRPHLPHGRGLHRRPGTSTPRWSTRASPSRRSAYGSMFYLTTGFHGLHVTGGLIAFLFVLGRTYVARRFTHDQAVSAIVVSYYWHFVDVVWIGLFATIYLIK